MALTTWSVQVMCLGDSITTGITHVSGSTAYYSPGGYRVWLEREANRRGHSIKWLGSQSVNPPAPHEGYPGFALAGVFNAQDQRIRWGLNTVVQNVLPVLGGPQPDIVIVNGGHNDIAVSGQDAGWAGVATLQSRARELCRMIRSRRPAATIYLVSCNPYKAFGSNSPILEQYDAELPAICAELRAEIIQQWAPLVENLLDRPNDRQYHGMVGLPYWDAALSLSPRLYHPEFDDYMYLSIYGRPDADEPYYVGQLSRRDGDAPGSSIIAAIGGSTDPNALRSEVENGSPGLFGSYWALGLQPITDIEAAIQSAGECAAILAQITLSKIAML